MKNLIGKNFALKVSHPENKTVDKKYTEHFFTEVISLSNLNHKNIVNVITAGALKKNDLNSWSNLDFKNYDEEVIYYYVMNYINGDDLLTAFSEFDENEKREQFELLITQISYALKYIHKNEIAHKDIKQQNILYSKDDQNFILSDFGFAHLLNSDKSSSFTVLKHADYISIIKDEYILNDIFEWALTLKNICENEKIEIYYQEDQLRYQGILNALNKAIDSDLNKRYKMIE